MWYDKIGGMEYIDLRKVGREGLKEIRRQVVRLKKLGKTGKEIEKLTGVRQNRASEIWTAYQGIPDPGQSEGPSRPGTFLSLNAEVICYIKSVIWFGQKSFHPSSWPDQRHRQGGQRVACQGSCYCAHSVGL